jgi:low temperature requirement protein LtrA
LHVRVGFFVFCFVGEKIFLKASTQPKASTPLLSLSFFQIFCIAQLVQSYFKRVEEVSLSLSLKFFV